MKLLLVEDNVTLAMQIKQQLQQADYTVDHTGDGVEALYLGREYTYATIIIDLGLPGMDGISLIQQWRREGIQTPILILTARAQWHEKVNGIDAGADDYLTKPFHSEELLARVRALIRRAHGFVHSIISVGCLDLDTKQQTIYANNQALNLTSHEYKLLAYLMHHPNQLVTKQTLTEHIYEQDHERDSNTIEVFIGRLRKKLPKDLIYTVRGQGYRLLSKNTQ